MGQESRATLVYSALLAQGVRGRHGDAQGHALRSGSLACVPVEDWDEAVPYLTPAGIDRWLLGPSKRGECLVAAQCRALEREGGAEEEDEGPLQSLCVNLSHDILRCSSCRNGPNKALQDVKLGDEKKKK